MTWTRAMVEARFLEAVETLKLLPGDWPRQYFSAMPQPIREVGESYNWDGARADLERSAQAVATAEAIDRLDQVLEWNRWLTRDEIRVVWGCALGTPRKWIARKIRRDRDTVYRWRNRALGKVLRRLNREEAKTRENIPCGKYDKSGSVSC